MWVMIFRRVVVIVLVNGLLDYFCIVWKDWWVNVLLNWSCFFFLLVLLMFRVLLLVRRFFLKRFGKGIMLLSWFWCVVCWSCVVCLVMMFSICVLLRWFCVLVIVCLCWFYCLMSFFGWCFDVLMLDW